MKNNLRNSLLLVTALAALPLLNGCQSSYGRGAAGLKTWKAIPLFEQEHLVEWSADASGRTNHFRETTLTNTYPANLVGRVYLVEDRRTSKKITARYFIGGGEFKDFSTESVDALGATNKTTVGSYSGDVSTNALNTLGATVTNSITSALQALKSVK